MTTSRPTTPVSRRNALAGLGAGGLGLALAAASRPAAAQDATPTAMAGHPFVGTWIAADPADPTGMPTTNVITADGGLIDPSVGAAGVWTATGERTADFTLIALVAEGGGSYFLVRGSLDVDAGGDTATATVSATHVVPDGTVLDQSQGTATYLRLKVEPQSAVGQPLAGFPTWTPPPATPTA